MILSKPSLHCRLEWRPSGTLQALLSVLSLLAVLSLLLSALPWFFSIPGSLLLIAASAVNLRKWADSPHCSLFWRAGDDMLTVNFGQQSESLSGPRCHRQGPLWIITGLDSSRRNRSFLFFPDTLTREERRLLRLVAATPLELD